MDKSAVITILEKIDRNKDGNKLTHHEVTVLAHGILSVLDDIDNIPSLWADEIELLLKMLTKRAPHHARCIIAKHAIKYLREGGEAKRTLDFLTEGSDEIKKSQESSRPEDF